MTTPKAMLIAMMEPPASLEEEFNDWYDTEHFPQRVGLAGFETASRWVCVSGWPRYVAIYDLSSAAVLDGAAYKAIGRTPWTNRVFGRTIGITRVLATQLIPGDVVTSSPISIPRLLLARYPNVSSDQAPAIAASFAASGVTARTRLFSAARDKESDLWAVAELGRVTGVEALTAAVGVAGGRAADIFNLYAAYRR